MLLTVGVLGLGVLVGWVPWPSTSRRLDKLTALHFGAFFVERVFERPTGVGQIPVNPSTSAGFTAPSQKIILCAFSADAPKVGHGYACFNV